MTARDDKDGEGYAGYTFKEARACDWTEDFTDENGNYWNHCGTCDRQFIGHKRRMTCKLCASTPSHAAPKYATPPFTEADRIRQQGPQVMSPPSSCKNCGALQSDPCVRHEGECPRSTTACSGEPGRIPDLEKARINAQYWKLHAFNADDRSDAVLAMDQAANAWKNAAYAMADQRDSARSAIAPKEIIKELHYLAAALRASGKITGAITKDDAAARLYRLAGQIAGENNSPDGGKEAK